MIHCATMQLPGQHFPFYLLFFFSLEFCYWRGQEAVGKEGQRVDTKTQGDEWDQDARKPQRINKKSESKETFSIVHS